MMQLSLFNNQMPDPGELAQMADRMRVKTNKKQWEKPGEILARVMERIELLAERYVKTRAGDFCKEGDSPVVEDIGVFLFFQKYRTAVRRWCDGR